MRLTIDSTVRVALGDPANPLGPDGLYDVDTGLPVNSATVELLTITDEITGAAVTGVTFPLTLSYLAGSAGVYKGRIPATAVLTEGRFYELRIRAVTPGGDTLTIYESVPAAKES